MIKKQKLTFLHIGISVSVTVFFTYFFQLEWVPKWIQENIQSVPEGQIFAYGAYFGGCLFIITHKLLIKPKQSSGRLVRHLKLINILALQ